MNARDSWVIVLVRQWPGPECPVCTLHDAARCMTDGLWRWKVTESSSVCPALFFTPLAFVLYTWLTSDGNKAAHSIFIACEAFICFVRFSSKDYSVDFTIHVLHQQLQCWINISINNIVLNKPEEWCSNTNSVDSFLQVSSVHLLIVTNELIRAVLNLD